mmetsp:Transcript_26551/g.23531  ORF Transcript_26551/g.23531 Transcript_26551/m.23531 type:complete len:81 (+) Transcript_26551:822-1064(+)
MAKEYLKSLRPNLSLILHDQGVFRNDFDLQLNANFNDHLTNSTMERLQVRSDLEALLDLLSNDVMEAMEHRHHEAREGER